MGLNSRILQAESGNLNFRILNELGAKGPAPWIREEGTWGPRLMGPDSPLPPYLDQAVCAQGR